MALRISAFTIELGSSQELQVAAGEDRQFQLTFTLGGQPIDFTSYQDVDLTVRNRTNGLLLFSRSNAGQYAGAPSAGTPLFNVLEADTAGQWTGPYDVDVVGTDATGYRTQLLVASLFTILQGVGEVGDPITTPPAIPLVYGINWRTPALWQSGTSGGYNLNDGVQAYDGALGATAISTFRSLVQGNTLPPVGSTGGASTGWAYVGQHGGAGATGPQGPTGPQGATGPAGSNGAQGPTGPQGATGPAGSNGAQGPAGPAWPPADGATSLGSTNLRWQGVYNLGGVVDGYTAVWSPTSAQVTLNTDVYTVAATGNAGINHYKLPAAASVPVGQRFRFHGAVAGGGNPFFVEVAPGDLINYSGQTSIQVLRTDSWEMVSDGATRWYAFCQGQTSMFYIPSVATGATGPQGATGPAGSTGATGPQGPTGPAGPYEVRGVAYMTSVPTAPTGYTSYDAVFPTTMPSGYLVLLSPGWSTTPSGFPTGLPPALSASYFKLGMTGARLIPGAAFDGEISWTAKAPY